MSELIVSHRTLTGPAYQAHEHRYGRYERSEVELVLAPDGHLDHDQQHVHQQWCRREEDADRAVVVSDDRNQRKDPTYPCGRDATVLPVRFDETELPGLNPNTAYLSSNLGPIEIAR